MLYLLNTLMGILMLFPFYWTIINALKPRENIITNPPIFYPKGFTTEHFARIFSIPSKLGEIHYLPMMKNSLFIGTAGTMGVCIVAALTGYALSVKEFPGRKAVFYLVLSAMLIPFQALLVPLFSEMNLLGLVDNHLSLILIYITFFQPLGMFIMKNSFDTIPKAMYESARIEGCGDYQIFQRIALPNVKMGLGTVAVFTSAAVWNEFLMALIFMTSQSKFTLPVGLAFSHQPPFDINWGLISAVSVLTFLPTIMLFIGLRKYFISGVTAGAISAE
ncbi:MAG: carbohydrate ABC transporter permease [Spirochaetales bacterium]|nr:carbohydrate ABC transporter permease [Spirochaetales bacterium]